MNGLKKKITLSLIAVIVILILVGCGGSTTTGSNTTTATKTDAPTTVAPTTAAPTTAAGTTTAAPTTTAFVKATNSFTAALTCPNKNYRETLTPYAVATYGTVTYTYSSTEDGTYTSTVPTNAGTYYVKANVAEGETYKGIISEPVSFTINKIDAESYDYTHLLESYTLQYGQKIGDIVLADGWHLYDDIETKVGNVTAENEYREFNAIYISENYNNVTGTVKVTVTKANNTIIEGLKCDNITYGEEPNPTIDVKYGFEDIEYSYSKEYINEFQSYDLAIISSGKYEVKAYVPGTDNYNAIETTYTFEVEKASGEEEVGFEELATEPITANYGDAVAMYLTGNWYIEDFDTSVGPVTIGERVNEFEIIYTPNDQNKYEKVTSIISFKVNRVLEDIVVRTSPLKRSYYLGEEFDSTGMEIEALYTDGSSAPITNYDFYSGNVFLDSTSFITVMYTENSITEYVSVPVCVYGVNDGLIKSIEGPNYTPTLYYGQRFIPSFDLMVKFEGQTPGDEDDVIRFLPVFVLGSDVSYWINDEEIEVFDYLPSGTEDSTVTLKIEYQGKSYTNDSVEIFADTIRSVQISPNSEHRTIFFSDDEGFDLDGLYLNVEYNSGRCEIDCSYSKLGLYCDMPDFEEILSSLAPGDNQSLYLEIFENDEKTTPYGNVEVILYNGTIKEYAMMQIMSMFEADLDSECDYVYRQQLYKGTNRMCLPDNFEVAQGICDSTTFSDNSINLVYENGENILEYDYYGQKITFTFLTIVDRGYEVYITITIPELETAFVSLEIDGQSYLDEIDYFNNNTTIYLEADLSSEGTLTVNYEMKDGYYFGSREESFVPFNPALHYSENINNSFSAEIYIKDEENYISVGSVRFEILNRSLISKVIVDDVEYTDLRNIVFNGSYIVEGLEIELKDADSTYVLKQNGILVNDVVALMLGKNEFTVCITNADNEEYEEKITIYCNYGNEAKEYPFGEYFENVYISGQKYNVSLRNGAYVLTNDDSDSPYMQAGLASLYIDIKDEYKNIIILQLAEYPEWENGNGYNFVNGTNQISVFALIDYKAYFFVMMVEIGGEGLISNGIINEVTLKGTRYENSNLSFYLFYLPNGIEVTKEDVLVTFSDPSYSAHVIYIDYDNEEISVMISKNGSFVGSIFLYIERQGNVNNITDIEACCVPGFVYLLSSEDSDIENYIIESSEFTLNGEYYEKNFGEVDLNSILYFESVESFTTVEIISMQGLIDISEALEAQMAYTTKGTSFEIIFAITSSDGTKTTKYRAYGTTVSGKSIASVEVNGEIVATGYIQVGDYLILDTNFAEVSIPDGPNGYALPVRLNDLGTITSAKLFITLSDGLYAYSMISETNIVGIGEDGANINLSSPSDMNYIVICTKPNLTSIEQTGSPMFFMVQGYYADAVIGIGENDYDLVPGSIYSDFNADSDGEETTLEIVIERDDISSAITEELLTLTVDYESATPSYNMYYIGEDGEEILISNGDEINLIISDDKAEILVYMSADSTSPDARIIIHISNGLS